MNRYTEKILQCDGDLSCITSRACQGRRTLDKFTVM